jgi:NAD-dependent DNA ligase
MTLESLLKYSSLHLLEADSHTSPSPQTPNPLRQEVDKLIDHLSLLSRPPPSVAAVEATNPSVTPRQIFQGKRVVFSGKLSNMTRQQAWELTEQLGILLLLHLAGLTAHLLQADKLTNRSLPTPI